MLWTRLWLLLLALVIAGLGLGAGLLYFDAEQKESQQRDVLWHKTQLEAELLLRLDAEQLIELATVIGSDATLAGSIEAHERGLAEPALLRQSIGKRLRRLAEQRSLDFLMVVDVQGLVLTRVGLDEARHGDAVIGWPLVQLGLRGYRLDDLYERDGRVYEVAAVPLPSLSHDRYAGALLIGRALSEKVGQKLGIGTAWRRAGKWLEASPPTAHKPTDSTQETPPLLLLLRPGSVEGVELWGWQPSGPTTLRSLLERSRLTGLPSRFLLRGGLVSLLLLGCGLLLSKLDRARLVSSVRPEVPASWQLTPTAVPALVSPPDSDPDVEPTADDALPRMYADFVAAKVRCGESLAGLSFEAFCDEILGGKERIKSDQGCREVIFRVHVHDGRATMRATPVW